MYVSPYRPPSPLSRLAYTFRYRLVFGLPPDVLSAALGIDQSEVEKIADQVRPLLLTVPPPHHLTFDFIGSR